MIKPINLKPTNLKEWEDSIQDLQHRIDKKQQQIKDISETAHYFQIENLAADLKGLQKYHQILIRLKDSLPEATFEHFNFKRVLEPEFTCSLPCSPSDFSKDGKCGKNGCYDKLK